MDETAAFASLAARPAGRSPAGVSTWVGIVVSLVGMLLIRETIKLLFPPYSVVGTVWREALMLMAGASLILLVRYAEKLPLASIGIGTSGLTKSLLWGFVTGCASLVVAGAMTHFLEYGHDAGGRAMDTYPLWLVTVIVLRAGIVEELFYRAFAIERLQAVGLSRTAAAVIPLVIFSAAHWTGGMANIAIAFVTGALLTGLYLWRRDLVSNTVAHFFVDFVANVLPRLLAGA